MDEFAEGAPCWADAALPDLRAGERFYGELFGWTFARGGTDTAAGDAFPRHSRALLDGKPVGALVAKRDGRMPTTWGVHLATPDLLGTVEKIRRAGGTVLTGPSGVGSYGRSALAADPEGAVFAVWQGGTRPGFGATDVPGAFCWTEVYVRNAEAADAFYPAVFGYALQDPPFDAGDFKTWALPGSGREVAGRAIVGDVVPAGMPPHFLLYFRVADVGESLATVRRAGGRVLVERQEIPGATFAVVVDNQGAAFAMMDGESGGDGGSRESGASQEPGASGASDGDAAARPGEAAGEGGAGSAAGGPGAGPAAAAGGPGRGTAAAPDAEPPSAPATSADGA
ncbi:VOC family protein [Streptomyces sp. MAR4 CNX-425]|uniref:VOC family protein n=1 Tax=Streptomyces sp. MAR4 CNX-425 TaxID=3406343 RepID=UPI003B51499F